MSVCVNVNVLVLAPVRKMVVFFNMVEGEGGGNQSIKVPLTKPHTGNGEREVTSQHHHRGQQTLWITKYIIYITITCFIGYVYSFQWSTREVIKFYDDMDHPLIYISRIFINKI